MNKNGPIVVIEDDIDDRDLLRMIFTDLGYSNDIAFFPDGESALEYLQDDDVYPFLILSDVNMPGVGGFEMRKRVHTNEGLSLKCIPYLFFSTHVDSKALIDSYRMSVQGFFRKPHSYPELKEMMRVIIEYWTRCYSPSRNVEIA